MSESKKLRVAVLYGGRSGEHEISLLSAASVVRNLDRDRFEVIPVAIDKSGRWLQVNPKQIDQEAKTLPVPTDAPQVLLEPRSASGRHQFLVLNNAQSADGVIPFDVIFPVMHGPLCEDGTIQGLMELADVPYVGCGVLASSVGMDKEVAKRLARDAGIPIVPYVSVKQGEWKRRSAPVVERVEKELGYPMFVKPANLGSSVGVHKVKAREQLKASLDDAFRYDTKVLIEKAVDAREIELSLLENLDEPGTPRVSVPGEIAPAHEFYSYEAKYLDENGAALSIPAKLTAEQTATAQQLAKKVFHALEIEGLTRVDLFLDRKNDEFYFNEVNTIPGFTSISMYPKMWEASGIPYRRLLSELVDLALARHSRKKNLVREFGK